MSKIFASNYIYQERMATCRSCDQFQASIKVCKSCGCFMPAKAKIAQIRCPKDKWTEVYGTSDEEPNTMSMFKGTDIDGKREALLRQAEHLKKESEKLIEEAKRLNGIN
jgi:hypothetical protein|tara:strand:+ start:1009 stop:1335 length:327 start_codon:yes stop_codon:yes gene_type:complete